jgi:peptidoglycan-associated lipoprotein
VKRYSGLGPVLALCFVSGCAGTHLTDMNTGNWLGNDRSGDHFGTAIRDNTQVMTDPRAASINLAKRFNTEVPATVTFDFNKVVLDQKARAILTEQANWIKQFPEVRFRVYGHTDLVGSAAYNKRLGLRRARAVVSFLVAQGINRSRLEAVSSFGETQPLIVTEGRERRNRRTVTEVTGFVAGNRLVLDGKYAQIIYRDYVKSAAPNDGGSQGSAE